MFLDAGHQFEALLDVMLVLGVADSGVLLSNGCQEILSKYRFVVLRSQRSTL